MVPGVRRRRLRASDWRARCHTTSSLHPIPPTVRGCISRRHEPRGSRDHTEDHWLGGPEMVVRCVIRAPKPLLECRSSLLARPCLGRPLRARPLRSPLCPHTGRRMRARHPTPDPVSSPGFHSPRRASPARCSTLEKRIAFVVPSPGQVPRASTAREKVPPGPTS